MRIPGGLYRGMVEAQELVSDAPDAGTPQSSGTPSAATAMENGESKQELVPRSGAATGSVELLGGDTESPAAKTELDEEKGEEEVYTVPFSRIWELNKPDKEFLLLGLVGAIVTGEGASVNE